MRSPDRPTQVTARSDTIDTCLLVFILTDSQYLTAGFICKYLANFSSMWLHGKIWCSNSYRHEHDFPCLAQRCPVTRTVSPDVLDIVRQTFIVVSRSLPPELNARMRLDQPDSSKDDFFVMKKVS